MIITWAAQGKPHYVSEVGSIPYISDIGADILKPLFIAGCSITGLTFITSLTIERWLRHADRCVYVCLPAFLALICGLTGVACVLVCRLVQDKRSRERKFSILSVLRALVDG